MLDNLDGWRDYPVNYFLHRKAPVPDEEQRAWHNRVDSTQIMLEDMKSANVDQLAGRKFFAYQYQHPITEEKHPAGLLIVNTSAKDGIPCIDDLVTHPGSRKAGGALMERAVQASDQAGKGGKVSLYALDDAVKAVYAAWGFTRTGDTGSMELDPERSDKWVKHDNEWYLASRLNEKLGTASSAQG